MIKYIYTPFISLYTPLKIPIEKNTNLPLNLFFLLLLHLSAHPNSLLPPKWLRLKKIVRMSENGVEISFKTVEKEDEKVDNIQVRFFFSHNVLNPDSKIRIS